MVPKTRAFFLQKRQSEDRENAVRHLLSRGLGRRKSAVTRKWAHPLARQKLNPTV
jgi:hypothetical protein